MKFNLFFIIILFSSCINKGSQNELNIKKLVIGDSKEQVIEKMRGLPQEILYSDSTYIFKKKVYNVTTFIYDRTFISFECIRLDFSNNNLIYISDGD